MKVGLVAGEASGDLLGAGLIRAIRERIPEASFEGVAGPAMTEAGCDAWADAAELAVFGLVEPFVHLPRLLKLRRSLTRRWRASPPDVFVGIDAPDFNLGLEKRLRQSGIRTAHYVSPSIWAWRSGRIKTVGKAADRVLCILPFEKRIYDENGIDAVFVGHPKATSLPADIDIESVRELLDLGEGQVVAVLPGSRVSEVKRIGPVLLKAAVMLAGQKDNLRFVTPVASPKLRPLIEAQLADTAIADRFRIIQGDSIEAMSAADVVMLASGTAALESALIGKPTVAGYAVSGTTAMIARMMGVKNEFYTLPNIVVGEELIPEFMQEDFKAGSLAQAVWNFLDDPERSEAIRQRFAKLRKDLALGADDCAAEAVINLAK
ncbi:MAG: lipid-A-disaccharide synthase [Woeseiaceae bacterium]|nr:lipid-A-disaccharide synthase [Woeseiaceae bacterium]NIP19714.1 lipid-A-disaccharide synthase [Woeseiaceae bacterium]NIS89831.1 lipid-A-disaccharide synthase [Woeseiaceae bacterium]